MTERFFFYYGKSSKCHLQMWICLTIWIQFLYLWQNHWYKHWQKEFKWHNFPKADFKAHLKMACFAISSFALKEKFTSEIYFIIHRHLNVVVASIVDPCPRDWWFEPRRRQQLINQRSTVWWNQSISNMIRWVAGLLGRSFRRLMVQYFNNIFKIPLTIIFMIIIILYFCIT